MSLHDRVITEYAGIGGRVAGSRLPFLVPTTDVASNTAVNAKLVAKAKKMAAARAETRVRLRLVSLESRRPLKTIQTD